MDKKYELSEDFIIHKGIKLYRIKALQSWWNIRPGTLGGYVEKEENLSQDGPCWIYHNAKVYENAEVSDWAYICNEVEVYGEAKVYDSSKVHGDVKICGKGRVSTRS